MVLISSTLEEWKADSTMEPPCGYVLEIIKLLI